MRKSTKIAGVVTLGLLFVLQSSCSTTKPTGDGKPPVTDDKISKISEEPKHPEIILSRKGHIDVNADKRVLAWQVSDPSGLALIETRIVKVESGSMKSVEVYRSDKSKGHVDMKSLKKGPGLYAILVKARNNEKEENEAGLRFSYAEVNPDCPTNKAWWPSIETDERSGSNSNVKEAPYNYYQQNLLSLSQRSKYIVTGKVTELIACPTKEGHLFTFVRFTNVKTLQKEDGANAKDAPNELILRIPGGMAHGRVEMVSDAPVFRMDEQVVLFLTRDPQQQAPIVQGTFGVLLLEGDDRIRSYYGPLITGISKDFKLNLDPTYKFDPKHARHWDPNMRVAFKSPDKAEPLGKPQVKQVETGKPIQFEKFLGYLKKAWSEASEMGKYPVELDKSRRRPYGETPRANKVQGG